ncbi:ferredoxin [Streptomyces sp. NPDC047315]|uniref:ferredoxin n=1 Tax=Streptomyces sp. NPDC047315 TaxID=3155142 RepID=UPI00340D8FE5
MTVQHEAPSPDATEALEVWIDQDLCTGDGICAQYAPDVFELDIDGLAYVKSADDELLQEPGATTPVPLPLLRDVVDSAKECPGDCIHVRRAADGVEVYGPDAE